MAIKRNVYFASFAVGMQFIVKDILEREIIDVEIFNLLNGAVLFETEKTYDRLNTHCFNNIFLVIAFAENRDIKGFIKQIVNSRLQNEILSKNGKKGNTFRIIVSMGNQLVSIDAELKAKLEKLIALQSGLELDKSNPDMEFWVLYRTEGFCFFMKRLSRHTSYEKILNKGELHPEIAYMMNWFSDANKSDVVLDPFCGNGSIPLNRALHFPAKHIYAFDNDYTMIDVVRCKITERLQLSKMSNITIKQVDIRRINRELPDESIDKIVTDPPWGLYENIEGIEGFYKTAIFKMNKVLKYDGIIVLLISRQIDIVMVLNSFNELCVIQQFDVLVSGKKACLIKLKKIKGI